MTDTTKKPMTLEQVHDDIKLVYYGAPDELTEAIVPLRKLLVWMHAINAQIAAQREDVFENTYHGVLLSKMVDMLRNNEWAELFTGEQVIADLQAEIARLVAAQREGEAVAWALAWPYDIDQGTVNINTSFRSREEADEYASWCGDPKPIVVPLYTSPRAAVTVTDEMVKSFEDMYKKVDTYPGFVGLRKSAVRAALEAVLKGR